MRLLASLADRMLIAVAPRVTAAAGCLPDQHQVACSACTRLSNHVWTQSQKSCHFTGNCQLVCTSCVTHFGVDPSFCV